ncbi:OLC1v1009851C1 [Oldenlandia corymbosa var. corymbosa]|uniref:OLC1v1009851C1 n=1 Tax=Oldenlandia corymbosa var. corymbosa TaxID=529605 RepID=A0AAV1DRI8_OLDCO|nr:OLC1v1009851C1 [Oldenlandia corymbosa var. corymbosa]
MASIRFAGLVFGVFIISLALKYSFACAQESGSGTTRKNRWLSGIESQNRASSQNVFLNDDVAAANIAGRKVLKGRKVEVNNAESSAAEANSNKVSTKPVDHHHFQQDRRSTASSSSSSSSSSKSASEAAAYEIMRQNHGDYSRKNPPHKKPPVNNDKPRN